MTWHRLPLGIIKNILPPANGDEAVKRWRWSIAIAVLVSLGVLAYHTNDAYGLIFSDDPFARTSTVEGVETKLNSIYQTLLRQQLLNVRERHCKAINEGNQSAMRFASRELQRLRAEYRELYGYGWQMPGCEDLI